VGRIEDRWRYDGNEHQLTEEPSALQTYLEVVKAFRSTVAADRLFAMIWRTLPPDEGSPHTGTTFRREIEQLEAVAAEAFVCAPDREAEVERIVSSHPSNLVREFASRQREKLLCEF
jgi:hypothetical protein